jgi:hypothetical protein
MISTLGPWIALGILGLLFSFIIFLQHSRHNDALRDEAEKQTNAAERTAETHKKNRQVWMNDALEEFRKRFYPLVETDKSGGCDNARLYADHVITQTKEWIVGLQEKQ